MADIDESAALLEELFDQEVKRGLPKALVDWIGKVLAEDKDIKKCPGLSWEELKEYLKDGVVLCRLINKLRKAADMNPVKVTLNPDGTEAIFLQNVETFLEGAYEYGIRKTACFLPGDLVNGRKGTMLDILFCLTALGFSANSQDYPVRYEPPNHPPPPKEEEKKETKGKEKEKEKETEKAKTKK